MNKRTYFLTGIFVLLALLPFSSPLLAQDCDNVSLEAITDPGPYTVATLNESDGIRNGPDYAGATIYYPSDAPAPFASIAIVPGFVSLESSIQDWGPFLASYGIVVMTIGTNSLFDDPYGRRDALLDANVTLTAENTRLGSPLFGAMDAEKSAVAGWSMGGGGAQLAAAADSSLSAALAFCPWLGNPSTATLEHAIPILIFSGEQDAVAPPGIHADIHYNLTPETTDKLLFEIENAPHNVANSPTGGDGDVGRIALAWLKNYLLNDPCYCPLVLETPTSASLYTTNVECISCPSDINGDGLVDVSDMLELNSMYGENCSDCAADINSDGVVGIADFLALNSAFGSTCP